MGCAIGSTLERGLDECGYLPGGIDRLSPTPRHDFPQALNSFFQEAASPKSNRLDVDLKDIGNVLVLVPDGCLQHNATSLGNLLGCSMGADPSLEFEPIVGIQPNSPGNARHITTLQSETNNSSHLCDTTLAFTVPQGVIQS